MSSINASYKSQSTRIMIFRCRATELIYDLNFFFSFAHFLKSIMESDVVLADSQFLSVVSNRFKNSLLKLVHPRLSVLWSIVPYTTIHQAIILSFCRSIFVDTDV